MMCQLWLPTISQVLWSCWVHFFGVLLFTENTSSLILPIVNTKSKSSVHFLWNEDEHQQGPLGLLWATSKKNSFMVSEMKQAYTEMLRIISTWTSRSVIQTLSVTCIVLVNCQVLLETTEKLGSGAAFPQLQIKTCYVKCPPIWPPLESGWSTGPVMGEGKIHKQLRVLKSLCPWVQLGVRWSPTEVAVVYSTICKCVQWEREVKNSTMRSSFRERKLNLESSQVVLDFVSTQFNDVSPMLLFVLLLRSLT